MTPFAFTRRLSRLGFREWLIIAEASVMLAFAALAIKLVPFRTLAGRLSAGDIGAAHLNASRDAADDTRRADEATWAVRAAWPFLPWRTVCFQKGLALHLMLRRRGIQSLLHYGVAQRKELGLSAHVWVSVGGRVLIGGREAEGFACLATYPATPQAR